MKKRKKSKKQLIQELNLSQLRIGELESFTAPSRGFSADTGDGASRMGNAPYVGTERELHDRIDGLLEEKERLITEISRLKVGAEWIDRGGTRFRDLAKLLPNSSVPGMGEDGGSNSRNFEDQLRQAQKMEAVGTLAGGIAHDFNNILTAIIASASLIQRGMEVESPLRRHLDRIFAAAERATALTQSILAYSRRQPSTPSPIKLNIIIDNLRKLLSRLIPENITFHVTTTEGDTPVMADVGQIEQVIMNLVSNAIDAMPGGGKLSLGTGLATAGKETPLPNYVTPGDYVVLTVADTGTGMDPSTRERLFQPFFTTKEVDKGTGLGLAMAYGIVKQHNGYIDVESEPDKGTSFAIYFPLLKENVKGSAYDYPLASSTIRETILLIEDDVHVRNLLKEILENYGYLVIEAVDGADGVEKFMTHRDQIRLLLSDVMMPGKNGKEAYNDIRKIRGDLRVIFISGYSVAATNEILGEGMDFLAKPVSPRALLTKIREALAR
ncbi:MAG TPA: ATP-binding protein [Geobacteraceae bacterium]|nr:ATP-binding protein [Geobacteraceae bacterium]